MTPMLMKAGLCLWLLVGGVFSSDEEKLHSCDIFLAPSSFHGGWGVYAARDFADKELVELAPLYVPLENIAKPGKSCD